MPAQKPAPELTEPADTDGATGRDWRGQNFRAYLRHFAQPNHAAAIKVEILRRVIDETLPVIQRRCSCRARCHRSSSAATAPRFTVRMCAVPATNGRPRCWSPWQARSRLPSRRCCQPGADRSIRHKLNVGNVSNCRLTVAERVGIEDADALSPHSRLNRFRTSVAALGRVTEKSGQVTTHSSAAMVRPSQPGPLKVRARPHAPGLITHGVAVVSMTRR